jgi:hypothetical protein
MCTVTAFGAFPRGEPGRPLLRLACNRDELRTRPAAWPPEVHDCGLRRAAYPIDPASGGTWIGVNDAGLILTLLNVNPRPADELRAAATRPLASRGGLVPALLACTTSAEAAERSARFAAANYPPFRLVGLDARSCFDAYSDGDELRIRQASVGDEPLFFTSSGLGDALVEAPRRALFVEMFAPGGDRIAQQTAFHRQRWPDRPHLSVCMSRDEARTVSYTCVEVWPNRVALTYHPDAPDLPAEDAFLELPRNLAACR